MSRSGPALEILIQSAGKYSGQCARLFSMKSVESLHCVDGDFIRRVPKQSFSTALKMNPFSSVASLCCRSSRSKSCHAPSREA